MAWLWVVGTADSLIFGGFGDYQHWCAWSSIICHGGGGVANVCGWGVVDGSGADDKCAGAWFDKTHAVIGIVGGACHHWHSSGRWF